MLASELNRRVKIQKKKYEKNNFGEAKEVWYDLYTISMHVWYSGGTRINNDQVIVNNEDATFTFGSYPNFDYNCRFIFQNSIWYIITIEELGFSGKDGYKVKVRRSEQDGKI
jgi:hypothetical protein